MSEKSHAAYLKSEVHWLPAYPSHWSVKRLKQVFKERDQRSVDGAETLLSVSAYTGVTPRSEIVDDGDFLSRAESLVGYKVCHPNDLIVNIMLAWNRGLGFARQSGIVSPAYCVYEVVDGSNPAFLNFLVRSDQAIWYFKAFSSGVIDSRLRIYPDVFGRLYFALPPREEQDAIVSFLGRETAKIDALVEEQRHLIELLKEKRQAVISQAVTKGLDPSVPMKDSGVEWLGKVPAHWVVCALRRVVASIEQGWSPECEASPADEQSWGVLKAGCVNRGVFDPSENKSLPYSLTPVPEYEVRSGDVLVSRASGSPELVGSTALVGETRGRLMLSDKIFRVHLTPQMASNFFVWAMNGKTLRDQIERALSGGNGLANNLPQSSMLAFLVAVPPIGEQGVIASTVDHAVSKCDALIAEADGAVALLLERRSALISAAVTGKIDVRGLAPQ
jgi:type I restriction enzyme S subunit